MPEETIAKKIAKSTRYGVEFFHIYSDEKITVHHNKSIEYLKTIRQVWQINAELILLIDNYNPIKKTLLPETVLGYLDEKEASPNYWALEADLVQHAPKVLEAMTDRHLKKSYEKYIEAHQKFPCSLLTATWYLIRLGAIDGQTVIKRHATEDEYQPVDRLINILPSEFKPVEMKVRKIIKHTVYGDHIDKIQDLFYDTKIHHKLSLF